MTRAPELLTDTLAKSKVEAPLPGILKLGASGEVVLSLHATANANIAMGIKRVDLIWYSSGAKGWGTGDRTGGVPVRQPGYLGEILGFADRSHDRGAILEQGMYGVAATICEVFVKVS